MSDLNGIPPAGNRDIYNLLDDCLKSATLLDADALVKRMPALLRDASESFDSDTEKKIMIYGTIVSLGCILPSVHGYYNRSINFPVLYFGLIAPAASNKSILNYSSRLLDRIHAHFKDESQSLIKAQHENSIHRPYRIVKISGDITSAKLIQQLSDNDGIPSIIIEDEIDTLVKAASTEHGLGISRLLRNNYHAATISQQLKGGNQHFEIAQPKLCLSIAGTPEQMRNLISSVENGLYSRFTIMTIDESPHWLDVSPCLDCPDREEIFTRLSLDFFDIWTHFKKLKVEFRLRDLQWKALNDFGERELGLKFNLENEHLAAIVKRHCNMAFRIAMILTSLRVWEADSSESVIECTDADFVSAMVLMINSYHFSIGFFRTLPGGQLSHIVNKKEKLLGKLPAVFNRQDALEVATALSFSPRQTDRFLRDFVAGGIVQKISHGKYSKTDLATLANCLIHEPAG